jgi:transposase-like protein
MTTDEREVKRKLRVISHAENVGNVAKTCRYFGIPRFLFYVWRIAYRQIRGCRVETEKSIVKSKKKKTPALKSTGVYIWWRRRSGSFTQY